MCVFLSQFIRRLIKSKVLEQHGRVIANMRYLMVFALLLSVTVAAPVTNSPFKNLSEREV